MDQSLRIHQPYCLKRIDGNTYIELNRDYKPLGLATQELVRYADFPLVSLAGLTPGIATQLSSRGSDDITAICLYDDGCVPTHRDAHLRGYEKRLALLAKLKVAPSPNLVSAA